MDEETNLYCQNYCQIMNKPITILGFAGSLRKNSYDKTLLRAAMELLPTAAELEIFDLEGIPPFNQDFETQMPEKVKEFKAKIKTADAILIATSEYNARARKIIKELLENLVTWTVRLVEEQML